MGSLDSVGTLLAGIANLIADGLRILRIADKRHWGPDEHEQVRALEDTLNEAKKDFQDLCPLVNGQAQYEHDRKYETITELRLLQREFVAHIQLLKDWNRSGGPINPVWVRETHSLQRDLHRAQCRAAGRIFASLHESSQRCLGAFLVRRAQRNIAARPVQNMTESEMERRQLEELAACTRVGSFDRFEDDAAFICDFCDGHLIWTDLEHIPTARTPPYRPPTGQVVDPHWHATGTTCSGPHEKHVIFAPVVVANHLRLSYGDWQAGLICPYCEEGSQQPQDKDDEEALYRPDDEFDNVAELQKHLEWQHPGTLPITTPLAVLPGSSKCLVM